MKEHREQRVQEARALVTELLTPAAGLGPKELAFVLNMETRLKRSGRPYVSGRQLGWLRGLATRRMGLKELAEVED